MYKLSSNKPGLLLHVLGLVIVLAGPAQVFGARIKDLATIQGVQSNALVGVGLVTGLDGTGDQTTQAPFTAESFRAYLNQFGIPVPQGGNFQLRNVAVVSVQAELPAFSKPGQTIDVTVSSLANATSLRGGSLERTFLLGADGQAYAMAQGNLVVGGLGVGGADGSSITINVPSVGRIPGGASVVQEVRTAFAEDDKVVFNLRDADFTTARRVASGINEMFGPDIARAMDAVSIEVSAPLDLPTRVAFISELENIEVEPGAAAARVIVNSRSGTIVIGDQVRVAPSAVTHGSLTVTISEFLDVSQPNQFGNGETVLFPDSEVQVEQNSNRMFLLNPGPTLSEVVEAINAVGAAPGDLAAILEALKQAGALQADLIII